MNKINAQEYLEKNFADKNIDRISLSPFEGTEKLESELIIQDYPQLAEIYLRNHELTSLTIINCPNLKEINVRNNQLTKLEIEGNNQISEIIAGGNELTSLNLTNCPKLKELIIPDNPLLTEIKGLNLSTIKNINITNTLINLAADYEEIKREKENLLIALKTVKESGEENELVLTEAIQNSGQAEEAIQRFLKKTEKEWREDFKNPEQALPSFQLPETRKRAKEILLWIIEARKSGKYQELVDKWNKEREKNEKEEYFTWILDRLTQLLNVRNFIRKSENQLSLNIA